MLRVASVYEVSFIKDDEVIGVELEELIESADPEELKIGKLLDTVSERGFGFLLVALSLPAAFPFPAVGYSVPFALLIIGVALQMAMGRNSPVLPQKVRSKGISPKMVTFIQKRGVPFLRRIERFSKPRLKKLSEKRLFRILVGMVILVLALIMLLPIPGTNTIFALAILLMGFGLANNDGLFILGGGLLGLTAAAIVLTLLIAGRLVLYHFIG